MNSVSIFQIKIKKIETNHLLEKNQISKFCIRDIDKKYSNYQPVIFQNYYKKLKTCNYNNQSNLIYYPNGELEYLHDVIFSEILYTYNYFISLTAPEAQCFYLNHANVFGIKDYEYNLITLKFVEIQESVTIFIFFIINNLEPIYCFVEWAPVEKDYLDYSINNIQINENVITIYMVTNSPSGPYGKTKLVVDLNNKIQTFYYEFLE